MHPAPSLFDGAPPEACLGPLENCFCLDFAVGLRFQERLAGAEKFTGALAALRIPEEGSRDSWELVFDDGVHHKISSPNIQPS